MKFTKMHGCGNDYIYINGLQEQIPEQQKPDLVRRLSDRHFGVGGDGVIFIKPSTEADFEMQMFNADGTRAEMCGNGIRCVAKYVYDKGLTDKTQIRVVSSGQMKELELTLEPAQSSKTLRSTVSKVRVNMGSPVLDPAKIPVIAQGSQVVQEPIEVNGKVYNMTCVSMGNPHAVIFTENVAHLNLEALGPFFEHHKRFPNRINTEFVEVIDRKTVFMRVWERGTGETLACGTGCCAVAVACVLNHLTDHAITVKLLGGELSIEWDREQNLIYMTGPAQIVFEGEIPYEVQ